MSPNTKKALIISGITVGAIAAGFLGYKLYTRLTKKVIEGKHNTIIVDEEEPEDVEVVGLEDSNDEQEPNWDYVEISSSSKDDGYCPEWYGEICS